jgi:hypothetical protein
MHRSLVRLLAPLGAAGLLATAGLGSAAAQSLPTWHLVQSDPQVINHLDTASFVYNCPDGARVAQNQVDDDAIVNNTSSSNVTMAHFLNYDGSLQLSFTNWNIEGDQTYSFSVGCDGPATDPTPVVAPTPVPSPQPQQQPNTPPIQVGLNQADFQAAYNALLKTLPPAPRTTHW